MASAIKRMRGYFIRKKNRLTSSIAAFALVQHRQRARLAKRFMVQLQHHRRALLEQRASVLVQRIYRGWLAKKKVRAIKAISKAISHYQTALVQSCVEIWRKRTQHWVRLYRATGTCTDLQRASAIHIGRLFRGCLARRKYISKRNRFLKNLGHWKFMCGSLVLRQYMVQKKRQQLQCMVLKKQQQQLQRWSNFNQEIEELWYKNAKIEFQYDVYFYNKHHKHKNKYEGFAVALSSGQKYYS
jgi:hypothetical protein